MKNIKIILLVLTLFSSTKLSSATVNAGPIKLKINPIQMIKAIQEVAEKSQRITESRRSRLQRKIVDVQTKLQDLGSKKDRKLIGNAEYEATKSILEQELARYTEQTTALDKRHEKFEDVTNNIVSKGTEAFMNHLQAENDRKTKAAVAGVTASVANEGSLERLKYMTETLSDSSNLKKAGIFLTAASVGITGGYYLTKLVYNQVSTYLNKKPALVEESSYCGWATETWRSWFNKTDHATIFNDMVFPAGVEDQLMDLAHTTQQAKKMSLPYRSVLLYGKPGTGKTMFAKKLAHFAGMDYAIVFGGRITADNIDELKEVFDWARTSPKGVVLFIDEADAFLSNRNGMSHENRQILNTFLALTGESSNDICVVLTSNRPQDLDPAINSRIDESIHMPLPDLAGREALLNLYFKKFILDDTRTIKRDGQTVEAKIILAPTMNIEQVLKEAAGKLDGHSGRTIAKMVNSLRLQAYLQDNMTLTQEMFDKTLKLKMQAAAQEAAAAA